MPQIQDYLFLQANVPKGLNDKQAFLAPGTPGISETSSTHFSPNKRHPSHKTEVEYPTQTKLLPHHENLTQKPRHKNVWSSYIKTQLQAQMQSNKSAVGYPLHSEVPLYLEDMSRGLAPDGPAATLHNAHHLSAFNQIQVQKPLHSPVSTQASRSEECPRCP